MDLFALCAAIEPIVREAGAYVRSAVPTRTTEKSGHTDLVTEYDVSTQKLLVERLGKLLPEAVFLGEEEGLSTDDPTKGYCFILDPIDGTANFVMGYDRSAVSVGLLYDGEPVLGMVCNPYADEIFSAVRGGGAFLNGRPIRVREQPLCDVIVDCGTAPYYPDLAKRTLRVLDKVLDVARDVRRMGSAAIDLCSVAAGRGGAFFELRLSPWDFAAAGLIVTEAGGLVTDEQGNPLPRFAPSAVIAGGAQAHAQLLEILHETP